jgi:SAM-dependent methyltransferase
VQADFDALPFAPGQFDLVVFNRSLHYAADSGATLERAHQALAPGGALVVMDSPTFGAEGEGAVTADEGGGYLTFAHLAGIAEKLALQPQFLPSRGSFGWRLRRGVARMSRRPAPAAFGLWVAR